MKKLLFYPVLLMIFSVACEDPLEGNIVPNQSGTSDFESGSPVDEIYTHWAYSFSFEGKENNETHYAFSNPDTGSKIYVNFSGRKITDAWATQSKKFTIQASTSQSTQDYGFTNPHESMTGQPSATVLAKFKIKTEKFCSSQTDQGECIQVAQGESKTYYRSGSTKGGFEVESPTPDFGKAVIYIPKEL